MKLIIDTTRMLKAVTNWKMMERKKEFINGLS